LVKIKIKIKKIKFIMNNQLVKMLVLLKNASLAKKSNVFVKKSPLILEALAALYKEGYILSYAYNLDSLTVLVNLRYFEGNCLTANLKIMSKISHVKYLNYRDICRFSLVNKVGFFLTSQGVQTLEECKMNKIGGILAFYS
jgi:ribosomal protein S8